MTDLENSKKFGWNGLKWKKILIHFFSTQVPRKTGKGRHSQKCEKRETLMSKWIADIATVTTGGSCCAGWAAIAAGGTASAEGAVSAVGKAALLPGVSAGTDEGSEVGNVTSERNGVTRYHFSHVIRDVTIWTDNVSYEPRVITVRSDNGSHKPKALTMKSDNFSPQCWSVMR
jgi:hypothetical protein